MSTITDKDIEDYQRHGVVVLRGVFRDWIARLEKGAVHNLGNPSHRALTHSSDTHSGKFFEDFYCWRDIPEYTDFVLNSSMGEIAARLMKSRTAQFFHDHYLDKEANTGVATPWHQDMPYYFVEGEQTVSFWLPLNVRTKEISLKCVAGSHLWPKEVRPTSWSTQESFYEDDDQFMDLPDIDGGDYDIKAWAMEPGDVVAFNFRIVHGANPNSIPSVNRTLSFRLVGDDVRYRKRTGRTSPNFPGIDQTTGERLREDWFPVLWHESND